MKLLEVEIKNCVRCPYGSRDSRSAFLFCSKACGYIKDTNAIPDWCPLPDKSESKADTYREIGKCLRQNFKEKDSVALEWMIANLEQGKSPREPSGLSVTQTLDTQEKSECPKEDSDRIYPCIECGKLRTRDEGGTTFTLCDKCWDKHYKSKPEVYHECCGQKESECNCRRE